VDEIGKLGGRPCVHQRPEGGCSVHARRPQVCRDYGCLWLRGALADEDRPDRLGAVLDFMYQGGAPSLAIREETPGAFDRSARLQAIAEEFRENLPVRITDAHDVMNPDRPFRVLLPGGEEQRVEGERVVHLRHGVRVGERRMPWLERLVRRLSIRLRAARLRHLPGAGGRVRSSVRQIEKL
jgi:hypothetical protein